MEYQINIHAYDNRNIDGLNESIASFPYVLDVNLDKSFPVQMDYDRFVETMDSIDPLPKVFILSVETGQEGTICVGFEIIDKIDKWNTGKAAFQVLVEKLTDLEIKDRAVV